MTHLYLVRHGASLEGMEDGKYIERGLSAEGVNQAERLRERLERTGEIAPDVLISSTLERARETAEILSPALKQPVTLDAEFEEWRNEDGSLSPETFSEMWRNAPEAAKPFFRFVPGCENWLEFSVRIQLALNRVLLEYEGKTIALVTHGGVIQAAFVYFFGYGTSVMPRAGVDVKNCSITHWFKPETRWILERFNDYQHL
ncbi:MAG: histidine phosphatase family protein [Chloroflexota bacterium]